MTKSWMDGFKTYFTGQMLRIVALGFASGLPYNLITSNLALWFSKLDINLKNIGLFALTNTPYMLKPLWAPLTDHMEIPYLTKKLGRRRGWLLFSQFFLFLSILGLGWSNPSPDNLLLPAIMSFSVTFWSATQDIVIDGYRIETLTPELQTSGGVVVTLGYRSAMIVIGAGGLMVAQRLGWEISYTLMAFFLLPCALVVIAAPEPKRPPVIKHPSPMAWFIHSFWHPLKDFLQRPHSIAILSFILLYQAGDYLMNRMVYPFYGQMGFTNDEIAFASKTIGLLVTIFGSLIGGILATRFKVVTILFWGGAIHALTNVILSVVAIKGHSMAWLFTAILSENFSLGILSAALTGYLSLLCNKEFSATQYALFSSLTALSRLALQSGSGFLSTAVEWQLFFIICAAAAIPGLLLLLYLKKHNLLEK